MLIFEYLEKYGYEELVFCHDQVSGLKGIIAIHDTTLGPSLGGTRMWPYEREEEAIIDALRLARAMTYKAAVSGLNLGGGKGVIIGDPENDKSEALWRAYGRYVQGLGGRYITAEDVGTRESDMELIAMETDYVTGTSSQEGSGDPSPVTAYGVWQGIRACLEKVYSSPDFDGRVVAVQGLGTVGSVLVKHLVENGARVVVADIDERAVNRVKEQYEISSVEPEEIYEVECDVFAPCALGAVINDSTLPRLNCDIIAGAANNILAEDRHGALLEEKGILYAPDYVINAGGLINVADELKGYSRERAMKKAAGIYSTLKEVFKVAERDQIPTYKAADILAEERLEKMARVRKNYIPGS